MYTKITLNKDSVLAFASMYGNRCGKPSQCFILVPPALVEGLDTVPVELVAYHNDGKDELFLVKISRPGMDDFKTLLRVSGAYQGKGFKPTWLDNLEWHELTGYVVK